MLLHCLNTIDSGKLATTSCTSNITVLEKQRERMKWQQHQDQRGYWGERGKRRTI